MFLRPSYVFLHSLHVLTVFIALMYISLTLSIHFQFCSTQLCTTPPSLLDVSLLSCLQHYPPVPHSSICPSLNQLSSFLHTALCLPSIGLHCFSPCKHLSAKTLSQSSRRTEFLLTILLLLAGDVNLNPGPAAQIL